MNVTAAMLVVCTLAGAAAAQTAPEDDDRRSDAAAAETTEASEAPQAQSDERDDGAEPTLDELLGLDEDGAAGGEEAARENEQELERRLSEEAPGDVLDVVLEKMAQSARRLDVEFDPGLGTQRVQLDVLERLDQLIDLAREMSSKMDMSGAGRQQQQPDGGQPRPGPQDRRSAGQQRSRDATDSTSTDLPPGREAETNPILEETESEWGHLPQRVRAIMEQGRSGYFSRLYRRLTEEYYKRLAEEGSN